MATIEDWKQANSDLAMAQAGSAGAPRAAMIVGARSGRPFVFLSESVRFALANGSPEHVGYFDDFLGVAGTALLPWAKNVTGAGTILPKGAAGVGGGQIEFSTVNNADNAFCTLALALAWRPNGGWMFWEARVLLETSVASIAAEFGISDALSETLGLAFSNHTVGGVFDVATDAAVFAFDTDGSQTTWVVNTSKGGVSQALDTGVLVIADIWYTLRIEVDALGKAYFYINGDLVAAITDAVTRTALFTPWATVMTRINNAAKLALVDYIAIAAERT